VRRDGIGTVTERALTVQLFGDPGHGDQCDGSGDDVELQVARPGQILQMGIARKVDRHIVHQRVLPVSSTRKYGSFTVAQKTVRR